MFPYIGRQTLNHWTTREVLSPLFKEPLGYNVQIETLAMTFVPLGNNLMLLFTLLPS